MRRFSRLLLGLLCGLTATVVKADPPRSLDDRLVIELVAAEPEIVTPTGVEVDKAGRIYCIESHTHFRPEGYTGPPADRIRVFEDFDEHGRARKVTTFFEGTKATMGLRFDAAQEWLYVVARSEMFRIRDTNGDGQSDVRESLVRLETTGDYPHNGLNGCAFDKARRVYFGQGENLGVEWKLIGADGATITGGDGGRVYRCNADGSGLEQIAQGCWNPFGQCFDAYGNLFVVDNDPDSRPPCRLLHVVPDADFGYRFSNGRKGLHPFSAWNGDLPGALPMVAGTGEAPSNVLVYSAANLPADYQGKLLVTSWGDHRIESYELEPVGASFRGKFKPVIVGDENFRPVGMAIAPDGSLVISDWVDKSYELHGKGRIWRIRAKQPSNAKLEVSESDSRAKAQWVREASLQQPALRELAEENAAPLSQAEALRRLEYDALSAEQILTACKSADPFLAQAARRPLVKAMRNGWRPDKWNADDIAVRLSYLLAAKEAEIKPDDAMLRAWLDDADESIRMTAVRWVGENKWETFRPELTAGLARAGQSPRAFATILAALERLDGVTRKVSDEDAGSIYVAKLIANSDVDLEILKRATALLRPDDKALSADVLGRLWNSNDAQARANVLRIWSDRGRDDDQARLAEIARDDKATTTDRAAAIAALRPADAAIVAWLVDKACSDDLPLAIEALRSLRGGALDDRQSERIAALYQAQDARAELAARLLEPVKVPAMPSPQHTDAWLARLDGPADAERGEHVFFHPQGPGCFKCHQVAGRGAAIGPELTTTARQLDRRRLLASILDPSAEVAPQFTTWTVATQDGRTRRGMLVAEAVEGTQTYLQADGTTFSVEQAEIAERSAASKSVMPDHLEQLLTQQEFRDLLAYLQAARR